MQPDDSNPDPKLQIPARQYQPLSSARTYLQSQQSAAYDQHVAEHAQPTSQQAVANIARSQLDTIYMNDPNHVLSKPEQIPGTQAVTPKASDALVTTDSRAETPPALSFTTTSPYERTHSDATLTVNDDAWSKYHTAWQDYYKQYFHRYYAGHLMQTQADLAAERAKVTEVVSKDAADISPEDAMDEIRDGVRGKILLSTQRMRKSRHFIPVAAALTVMIAFLALQYSPLLISRALAYSSPGAINPSNIIVDPSSSSVVTDEELIIIPKINVTAPTIYENTMGTDNKSTYEKQLAAMENGVAWFGIPGANSKPGQLGNTVISGHSSNAFLEAGNYKFVFARLEQLKEEDVIYLHYKGVRYTYKVFRIEIVGPSDSQALLIGNDKPYLTLITCTPLGTSEKRLLVFAEQISPSAASAAKANDNKSTTNQDTSAMPGSSPGFVQNLFGAN